VKCFRHSVRDEGLRRYSERNGSRHLYLCRWRARRENDGAIPRHERIHRYHGRFFTHLRGDIGSWGLVCLVHLVCLVVLVHRTTAPGGPPLRATFSPAHPLANTFHPPRPPIASQSIFRELPLTRARAFQFAKPLFRGVAKDALHCAHRGTTVSSWGLCEQEGPSVWARSGDILSIENIHPRRSAFPCYD
jgi:hypothetical protein